MKGPTLLERLTGSALTNDPYDDLFEDDDTSGAQSSTQATQEKTRNEHMNAIDTNTETNDAWDGGADGTNNELAVDVYQTKDEVIIKALVAGVLPSNLDISLTRDMLTIKGARQSEKEEVDDNYFQRELYWGEFSRTILLPEEVDVENAQASEKHGILMVRLPKIDKKKAAKLKVKSR